MKNELWAICKGYQEEDSHLFYCYKCHKLIRDAIQFTVHIMKKKGMEFRHYHIGCAPKRKLDYVVSRLKQTKETKERT